MKAVVFNLGCKVNQYDSDALIKILINKGYEVSEKLEYADYYILNTCAVTRESEKKSRQCIARVKKFNPDARIFVCGCASEKNSKQFIRDGVVYISGTAHKALTTDFQNKGICVAEIPKIYEDFGEAHSLRTRSYIKVQDGCNNFCNYCIVPYLRGRSRSRQIDSIKTEITNVLNISKEIVLTGINLSAYGRDIGITLADLIKELQEFDIRIRLGSLEVNVINDKLLTELSCLKKFCPHFHLSLQSGNDRVLKAMNRHYTVQEFYEKVQLIRKYFPNAGITTDVIAGFPTETNDEFSDSLEFIKSVGFSDIHVFSYSRREGTVAYDMEQVEKSEIKKRAKILKIVKLDAKQKYETQFIGKPLEVLFEDKEGEYTTGYSRNYIKVYKIGAKQNDVETVKCDTIYKMGLK